MFTVPVTRILIQIRSERRLLVLAFRLILSMIDFLMVVLFG
mgnify:CR=1 FL=1